MKKSALPVIVFFATQASCSFVSNDHLANKDGHFKSVADLAQEDFGDIEGGLIDPRGDFQSLLRTDGESIVAEIKTSTTAVTNAQTGKSVPVAEGTCGTLIFKNGSWARMLFPSAENGELIEGYIKWENLSVQGAASEMEPSKVKCLADLNGYALTEDENGIDATLSEAATGAEGSQNSLANAAIRSETARRILASRNRSAGSGSVNTDLASQVNSADQSASADNGSVNSDLASQIDSAGQNGSVDNGSANSDLASQVNSGNQNSTVNIGSAISRLAAKKSSGSAVSGTCAAVTFKLAPSSSNSSKVEFKVPQATNYRPFNAAGGNFRDPSSQSHFEIEGSAHKIRVIPTASGYSVLNSKTKGREPCKPGSECAKETEKVYVETVHDVSSQDPKHLIQLNKILTAKTEIYSGSRQFVFELLDGQNAVVGSCTLKIGVVSPIVFDLEDKNQFEGGELGDSTVRFDLLGNGQKTLTGWAAPSMGFLALDVNKNGKIDSGRELFGEGTVGQNGIRYENGYSALNDFDTNQDGTIDASDSVYKSLLVWRDLNSDGVSQPSELQSLAAYNITRLSLSYGPSLRHGVPKIGQNDVRFESRYFGPKRCGETGCLTFDVFFATAQGATAIAGK